MYRFCTRFAIVAATLLQFSAPVSAGPLDDYYLQQFGEASIQLEKALLSVMPAAAGSARCGMPLKQSLQRDWNLLEQSTQKVLAKQLAYPALAGKATFISGHFKVHYATTGSTDAPPSLDVSGITGVPDWVETVAATFETVYTSYNNLGYQPAPTSNGVLYDIYLLDLAPQRYYGSTTRDQPAPSASYPYAYTSWIELDNNFTDSIYSPYTPLQSLQVTAAHEYHHAIQFGYNVFFDIWYAEATSTWLEDELYDSVNQLYNYNPAWFINSTKPLDLAVGSDAVTIGAGYGRWIFNRYLAEKHTPAMIRSTWEKLAGLDPKNNPLNSDGDIQMVPVLESILSSAPYGSSLGADFFDFAKRVYTRAWTTRTADIPYIHLYSPLASYSTTSAVYAGTSPAPTVTLPHYSFAYYRFEPTAGVPSNLSITVTGTNGIKAAAFIKSDGGVITEYPFATVNGTTVTIPGFSTSSEAVLLIANTVDSDNHTANFSTNGTGLPVTDPSGGTVYPPLQPAAPTNINGGSSSGGGCFIATAAYGSYLHPQVQLLRDFRDKYLLNNAPGRVFVSLYYRFSPQLADSIARHPLLRSMVRLALTPLVVTIAHPLVSITSLFLLLGTGLLSHLSRINAACSTSLRNRITPHNPR